MAYKFDELENLSEEERKIALKILDQYAEEGKSELLDDIIEYDYKEQPVDIITFVKDPQYLGNAWHLPNGEFKLFPYWEKTLKKIFPDNKTTDYNTLIESGARGLGKSEIAVLCGLYLMHRLMCLRDPYDYLNLKTTEQVVFAFMNIKIQLAEDIGMSKLQNTVQMSPWFMERGTISGTRHKKWNPPSFINIIVGSQADSIIGQAVYYCLDGDTLINTTYGDFKIKDLVDKEIKVPSIDNNGNIVISDTCTVKPTATSDIEYQIELEDGSIIKCTPNHRFMLKNGSYKEAQDLTEDDELFEIQDNDNNTYRKYIEEIKIKSIKRVKLDEPKQYYDVINADPFNNFLVKTNNKYIVSHNCFMDEISFIRNMDVEIQKKKALNIIDTAIGGMKTRFLHKGVNPTLMVVASSKRSENSFMEEYIRNKAATDLDRSYIVDEPVWNVQPPEKFSKERFKVAVGNKFLVSEVIPDSVTDVTPYVLKGYKVIDVPVDFKINFIENIDRALRDFAGISSTELSKYISGDRVSAIVTSTYKNPFEKDIITVGNAKNDYAQYSDFFNMENIDPVLKNRPLYIHYDTSLSGDKTGIAGVWVVGKRKPKENELPTNELYYKLAFSVAIEAPKGHQISFAKNRQFVYWLKENGFNIKGISSDSFQSANFKQDLERDFDYSIISVDRVKNGVCEPYHYLKSTIYDERLVMYHSHLLIEEITGLERNATNGRIDHSPSGINSKDVVDGLCGSIWNASLNAEEFAFNFGEFIEEIIDTNLAGDFSQHQIQVELEKELAAMLDPFAKYKERRDNQASEEKEASDNDKPKEPDHFLDFGMGKAQEVKPNYLNDNIVWW